MTNQTQGTHRSSRAWCVGESGGGLGRGGRGEGEGSGRERGGRGAEGERRSG